MKGEKYWVFKRSCRNWQEFATASKYHMGWAYSHEEAVKMCDHFNDNRSYQQVQRGTKAEFTSQY